MPRLPPDKQNLFLIQWMILGIALLMLGGATGLDLYVEHGRTASREEVRLMTQARVIERNLEQNLSAINRVLAHLRTEIPIRQPDPGLSEHLKILTDAIPGVRTLRLLDKEGAVIASSRSELPDSKLAYLDYLTIPRQNPNPDTLFVSAPVKTSLGTYGINVSRTIVGLDKEFAGLIVATLDDEYFKTVMESARYAPDMWTAIAHGDGIQFLMVPEREGQAGKNLAQPGSFFSRHRDSGKDANMLTGVVYATGEERMMALRTIQPAPLRQDKPLIVAVGRELNAIYAAWRRDLEIQGGLFGLIFVGSILGLHAYQRRQREFARKAAESAESLAASERFMRALTDNIPGLVAYWSNDLRCRFANHAYVEWFCKTPEQMRDIRLPDLLGEELFRKNEAFINAALRGQPQRFERTLTKTDGSIVETWAQYIPDLDGQRVRGFIVLVADITELKQAERALTESEMKLKMIIETEPECVKILAADGRLLQMNRAGLDMIEADSDTQVVGHPLTDIVLPQYREAFENLNARVNQGESGSLEFEIVGLKGGHRWLDTHAAPMRDATGQITGLLGVTRDITARKAAEQALEQLAQTDFLTQLANRRHFMFRAEQELSRVFRYGGSLSVLMMDIDHFKLINDSYGHRAGDIVLQRFSGLSRQTLRDIDVIGRIGGEEFAVVLPQTDGERALEVAERIRVIIGDASIALDQGLSLRFTVSIGVATLTGVGTNIDTLLSQADQALYQAKNSGRNRVAAYARLAAAAS